MIQKFSKEYVSLKQVEFEDFLMRVNFKTARRRGTDSPVEIKLSLQTSRKQNIYFSAESRSMIVATISVIRKAFEYFINAEIAMLALQKNINNSMQRNRTDLSEKYTLQMAELVRIISYENVLRENN